MKRFVIALVMVLCCAYAAPAASLQWDVVMHSPKGYKLLVFTGADPTKPLPRGKIIKIAEDLYAKEPVNNFQIAVYDAGKQFGDGLRAYGSKHRYKKEESAELFEVASKEDAIYRELWCGLPVPPAGLPTRYASNEIVADEIFKGKPVIICGISSPGIRKCDNGQPCMEIPARFSDEPSLLLLFDPENPGLREIRYGPKIDVRGYPKGVVNGRLIVERCIVIPPEKKQ